jgi:hypothetical protein
MVGESQVPWLAGGSTASSPVSPEGDLDLELLRVAGLGGWAAQNMKGGRLLIDLFV